MEDAVFLQVLEASIENPNDTAEVNVIAAVASVGINANGIEWTEEFLQEKADTFIGMPVNIFLDAEGEPTGHSRQAIGSIIESWYDRTARAIMVKASLWGHYFPRAVKRIKELYSAKKLKVSMEFLTNKASLVANEDGSQRPVDGRFSGMGFVRNPADTGQFVQLVAALAEDQAEQVAASAAHDAGDQMSKERGLLEQIKQLLAGEEPEGEREETAEEYQTRQDEVNAELSAAHEGSFEWTNRRLMEHLSANRSPDEYTYHYVIATYANYAIYQEGENYYRIDFKRSGDKLNFGEPTEVDPKYEAKASVDETPEGEEMAETATPTPEMVALQSRIEALEADLAAEKAKTTEYETEKQAAVEEAAATKRAEDRLAEINTIAPVKSEELKASLQKSLRDMSDEAFTAFKDTLAAQVKPAGMGSDATIENPDPTGDDAEFQASLADWRKEQAARYGAASVEETK